MDKETLKNNLLTIREKMGNAEKRSGRDSGSVKLVAVTKKKTADIIADLIDLGQKDFGENYPEETETKIDVFKKDNVHLYMIGHLQSRKVKLVAENFYGFQSVDRLEIAQKMNAACAKIKRTMPVMIECNLGAEETKSGWVFSDGKPSDSFYSDLDEIIQLSNLNVEGLMTLPPYAENGEENRTYFIQMRKIAEEINCRYGNIIKELSMGTSSDFETAIEEGATMVRIGTSLVGPRDY